VSPIDSPRHSVANNLSCNIQNDRSFTDPFAVEPISNTRLLDDDDVDSDTESIASFAFSDASGATIESCITDFSQDDIVNACAELFALIAHDSDLCPLFSIASKTKAISAEDFAITLRRSLKRLAQDLRSEVLFEAHKRATSFISSRARVVARDIVNSYWCSNESKEQYPRDGSSSDEDGEDIKSSEQPASFDGMKTFIRSSAAFSKFIKRIHRYVHEPPISWDSVRKQWEEELHTFVPIDLPGNPTIRILESDNSSLVDLFKLALERYSGEEWLWKPFAQPRRKLVDGKLRVLWKHVSTSFLFQVFNFFN
jgi:hypothetical protein